MTPPILRAATVADLTRPTALLAVTGLPSAGVADHLAAFLVAEDGGGLVDSAGLEIYGRHPLRRSVAVATNRRGTGLGRTLIEAAVRQSTQFNGICPATAVAMQLELNPEQAAS